MKSLTLIFSLIINSLSFSQTFEWAIDANGGNVASSSIATDALNNVYVAGYFTGTVDFDHGPGTTYLTDHGWVDAFILKLTSNGDLLWAKSIGGTGDEKNYAITVDQDGNVYSAGLFDSMVDFDPNAGEFFLSPTGDSNPDIFIQKLDTDGNFIWAKRIGNSSAERVFNLTTDDSGNVISTGDFKDAVDFDPNAGTTILTAGVNSDYFVLKLTPDGDYVWAVNDGGADICLGIGVGTDHDENVYITGGYTGTTDLDPSPDASFAITSNGYSDAFLLKLNADGEFVWAKSYGSSGNDYGVALAVSDFNNIFVSGVFHNTVDFDPNEEVVEVASAGQEDVYLQKIDSEGNLLWVNTVGSSDDEFTGFKIALDSYEQSTIISFVDIGSYKTTVTSFASDGNEKWFFDLDNVQNGISITNDSEGFVYPTGKFSGVQDFNPFSGTSILSTVGANDYYLLKFGAEPNSIDEIIMPNSLSIYPNPSNGKFKIKFSANPTSTKQIKILNTAGKIVLENTPVQNSMEVMLDISLLSGVYFVQLTLDSGEVLTEKIIITNDW